MRDTKCLVLFSGGKDSFITACKQIEKGFHVCLFSCNNGAVAGEENLLHGATRLQKRYGEDRVQYAGIYNTSSIINQINTDWTYMTQELLGKKYPNLVNAQMTCLHCQTAMWVSAIAYATAHDIGVITSGYRESDTFCTGHKEYIQRIIVLAKHFGIQLDLPVWKTPAWDKSDGWERDMELTNRGFVPKVLEPRCLLGRPVNAMSDNEKSDMTLYFDDHISSQLEPLVNQITQIFKNITLSEASLEAIHYPASGASKGLY